MIHKKQQRPSNQMRPRSGIFRLQPARRTMLQRDTPRLSFWKFSPHRSDELF
jgi:hypothetical protein